MAEGEKVARRDAGGPVEVGTTGARPRRATVCQEISVLVTLDADMGRDPVDGDGHAGGDRVDERDDGLNQGRITFCFPPLGKASQAVGAVSEDVERVMLGGVFGNANFGHLDQHGDAPELAHVVGTSAQRGNGLVGPVPTVTLVDEGPRPARTRVWGGRAISKTH